MKLCGCPRCVDRFNDQVAEQVVDGAPKKWSHALDVGKYCEWEEPEPTAEGAAAIISDTTKNVQ